VREKQRLSGIAGIPENLLACFPDKTAGKSGLLRVVDESGEDYLYPADYFVAIKLLRTVQRAVDLAS
jgi:hypothetical protein